MKINIPSNSYVKGIEVNDSSVDVTFEKRKKVALLFISLNEGYWPYLTQVIKDCRKLFLPHHHVDYFIWTDFSDEKCVSILKGYDSFTEKWEGGIPQQLAYAYASLVRLYSQFYPDLVQKTLQTLAQTGITFRLEGAHPVIEAKRSPTPEDVKLFVDVSKQILTHAFDDFKETTKGVVINETGAVAWPAPTLMRYHLFLNEEEKLKDYDYMFYLDADMRVVDKISGEILGEGLTTAPHPGYVISSNLIPPYEPNKDSTAFIHRLGRMVDEGGKKRFVPFYAAGGFQGGTSKIFIAAMKDMKKTIDTDFDNNYVAVWNDESHWNKYLWDFQKTGGNITFLDVSYIYPDSLIKEYYEKIWGRAYAPKIITLTKPFSLSPQGASDLKQIVSPLQ